MKLLRFAHNRGTRLFNQHLFSARQSSFGNFEVSLRRCGHNHGTELWTLQCGFELILKSLLQIFSPKKPSIHPKLGKRHANAFCWYFMQDFDRIKIRGQPTIRQICQLYDDKEGSNCRSSGAARIISQLPAATDPGEIKPLIHGGQQTVVSRVFLCHKSVKTSCPYALFRGPHASARTPLA